MGVWWLCGLCHHGALTEDGVCVLDTRLVAPPNPALDSFQEGAAGLQVTPHTCRRGLCGPHQLRQGPGCSHTALTLPGMTDVLCNSVQPGPHWSWRQDQVLVKNRDHGWVDTTPKSTGRDIWKGRGTPPNVCALSSGDTSRTCQNELI